MRVLLSGFPPFGGSGSPPKSWVTLRMKVDLPHPESAARPMTMVFCSPQAPRPLATYPACCLREPKRVALEVRLELEVSLLYWAPADLDPTLAAPPRRPLPPAVVLILVLLARIASLFRLCSGGGDGPCVAFCRERGAFFCRALCL